MSTAAIATERIRQRQPVWITVKKTARITPRMKRVWLAGPGLARFPADRPGAHIKLFFPREGQQKPDLPRLTVNGPVWPARHERPITRTYSVRFFDPDMQQLAVDFVCHGDEGPASAWAERARPGDVIGLAGPGGPDPMLAPAEWYVLVGDLTALPAISALLEWLPATARGRVLMEVPDEPEIQTLDYAADLPISWLVGDTKPGVRDSILVRRLGEVLRPNLSSTVWLAGETAAVVAMRAHVCELRGIARRHVYAVPYWKAAAAEEVFHAERHRIMDEM